jgi:hypothetical protein
MVDNRNPLKTDRFFNRISLKARVGNCLILHKLLQARYAPAHSPDFQLAAFLFMVDRAEQNWADHRCCSTYRAETRMQTLDAESKNPMKIESGSKIVITETSRRKYPMLLIRNMQTVKVGYKQSEETVSSLCRVFYKLDKLSLKVES